MRCGMKNEPSGLVIHHKTRIEDTDDNIGVKDIEILCVSCHGETLRFG